MTSVPDPLSTLVPVSSVDRSLFPTEKQLHNAWTTCTQIGRPEVEILPLGDHELHAHRASPSPAHPVVTPPRGSGPGAPSVAWEASYPEKSIDPKSSKPGGFGFYLSGPPEFYAGLRTAKEALISYSVMFEKEWDFVKGGKLPGICEQIIFI